jgi:DNA polymerase III alpha subunit
VLPERLAALAARAGHTRLAVTDVNNLYGAPRFHRCAVEAGLKPIIGAELRDGRHAVVALVADETGYRNLCRVLTRLHGEQPFRLADHLAAYSDGLHLVLVGGGVAALAPRLPRGRLWVGIDGGARRGAAIAERCALAARHRLPVVATAAALLPEPGDADVARVLAAVRTGRNIDDVPADQLPPPAAHLRRPRRLAAELAACPQALRNNRRLADQCAAFRLLPRRAVFPAFSRPGGPAARDTLRRLCRGGLRRRYGPIPPPEAEARLDRELRLIERMGFAEYFLVVWDIVRHARRRGAPVAGRGSGASSLVAYVLGITNVCPLTYRLPFERFLHERRDDFPDLDVDFCWRIRDDVIDDAFRRWGADRAAMVCTHNTFQPRSALRETAKAFGFSDEQISRGAALQRDARLGRITALSRRLIDLPRHLSVHPGGIVIGREPIDHYVPVQPAVKGVRITHYDKDGIEAAGLVKLDLLGNRSLSTVRYACDLLRRRGEAVDVEALPPDDPATVATLCAADTVGCNQLESPAMRHLLRMMQPRHVRDVMKALALIRPGAASIGMKEAFIRRHRGLERAPRGDPQTDALLRDTYGVMLYEDDVMLVAAALLGATLPEGDRFRKAVQHCRDDDERRRLSDEFLARCRANGIDPAYAKALWVQMAKFNAYSFCRAHAGSYALLAYAGAYLKTHAPLEFWTAALNNNQSMYPLRVYVACAQRSGVCFRLPDANRSIEEFAVDDGAIRVGLNVVEGLGPAAVEDILHARRRAPFAGLTDFLGRTHLSADQARALILCGAFDFTGRTRPALMMELNLFARRGRPRRTDRPAALDTPSPALPQPPRDYALRRKYTDELRILGFAVGGHVMALWRPRLAGRTDADSRHLPRRVGRRVRIAGVLEAQRTTRTDRGQTMMFLTLDDEHGLFEAALFPDALRRTRAPFDRYGPYLLTGTVEDQYGAVTITAGRVELAFPSRRPAAEVTP